MPTQKLFLDNTGLTLLLDELGQYLKGKLDKLTFDTTPTTNSTNPVTSGGVKTALDGKQDTLVSGTNIKTVNGNSLLGSGNLKIDNIVEYDHESELLEDYLQPHGTIGYAGDELTWYIFDGNEAHWLRLDNVPLQIKTINNNSLLGSGNIEITASDIEQRNGDTVQDSLDALTNSKQDRLVSGTNIKTINTKSLVGSGDVVLEATDINVTNDDTNNLWASGDPVEDALDALSGAVASKQANLVSGTNIKTVNNNSLLGNGNVQVGDITGEELETEIEELESTLLTDALRKSAQVLLPAEKTQVLTNLGIADVAKESNLKTVNGASLIGNGNIEIVSVNAGDINVMQGTGDSQTDVMSQKAVTEYGRKVTVNDLNGTSNWIKEKLTAAGWEFGVRLGSDGRTYAYSGQNTVVTCIIPVNENIQGHQIIFTYKLNKITSAYINGYNESDRMGYINGQNDDNAQSTTLTNAVYANLRGLRFTVDFNNIPACSIYDNTSKKYIWRGDEYLYNFIKNFNVNIAYDALLDSIISQEFGPFTQKTISLKVISEQFDAHDYIDKRYTYMNGGLCAFALNDYPNIDIREADGISLIMDGENVAVSYNAPLLVISNTGSLSSTNPMFMIHRYWSSPYVGFMNGWTSPVSGQGTSFPTNKTYNKWAHQVITFDFNTGEGNIYVNGTLWTTATVANFDKNAFRTALRAQTHMYLSAPSSTTQPTKITGLAVFPRALTASEVTKLFGAGGDETRGSLIPALYNAYDTLAHVFTTWNIALHTVTATVTTNENGGKNLTLNSNYDYMLFGITGTSSKTSFYNSIEFDFTITSGSCKFVKMLYNNNHWTTGVTLTDSNGNTIDFANTVLTTGNTYHIRCVPTLPYNPSTYGSLTVAFVFGNMEGGTVLWVHENVVIKEQGAALKLLKENFRGTYWELYNGYQIPISTNAFYNSGAAFNAYLDPFKQNTILYSNSVYPLFNGLMAVDPTNNKVYVGILNVNGGTWKQINNS